MYVILNVSRLCIAERRATNLNITETIITLKSIQSPSLLVAPAKKLCQNVTERVFFWACIVHSRGVNHRLGVNYVKHDKLRKSQLN